MSALAVLLAVLGVSQPALAAWQTVIADTTDDIAYLGTRPYAFFGGYDRGDVVGSDLDTSRIVVTESRTAGGGLAVDIRLDTQFVGVQCFAGTCARYADLFLRSPGEGYGGAGFDYAIALGAQVPNGGLGTPGLYTVTGYRTSQDVWRRRTDFAYGGTYTDDRGTVPARKVPTVLTSGTRLADATVSQHPGAGGTYVEDVSFTVDPADAGIFLSGYDLLWGTGDCGNDTVFGSVAAADVPEPAGIAVLAGGLAALGLVRRHRKRAPGRR